MQILIATVLYTGILVWWCPFQSLENAQNFYWIERPLLDLATHVFSEQEKYKKRMQTKKTRFAVRLDVQALSVKVWQNHKRALAASSSYIYP